MDFFDYKNKRLCAESVDLKELAAEYGTPLYVYSRATLERHWRAFDDALAERRHLVCYAVKANSNVAVLNVLARLGSGFDIVSVGELERVLAAGGDPKKVVFSGVGKRSSEIRRALQVGIRCFNVESLPELKRINRVAMMEGNVAAVSLRVNPDVDAKTHPYISTGLKENKFGIAVDQALTAYQYAASLSNLQVVGIDCHIGSQLTEIAPFVAALQRVLALVEKIEAAGIELQHLDLGGGLGICYDDETPPEPRQWAEALNAVLGDLDKEIIIEPGRAIAGNAGILLTEVEFLKPTESHNFAIVDAAMNDLLRPALYQAWQKIVPVLPRDGKTEVYDVVGPICETGDFLGKGRELCLQEGDLLAIRSSGAYGFTMSSNYNSRPRAAEVMVDGEHAHLVRARETVQQLMVGESLLPE
ncbi:MAG: diaminopimelate decarboxylase [Gammaproteobacteria bacterium]|nr:diaminopimelate decarboxylase [Gammaproteobacteria bacterium]